VAAIQSSWQTITQLSYTTVVLMLLPPVAAVVIQSSRFESNAADDGGAVAVFDSPSVHIQDCIFAGNEAHNPYTGQFGLGGVINAITAASMVISTSNFTGNIAGTAGAILMQNASTLNMTGVQLVGNVAKTSGGALVATGKASG
jgi:predicted outer membrane repeat protein